MGRRKKRNHKSVGSKPGGSEPDKLPKEEPDRPKLSAETEEVDPKTATGAKTVNLPHSSTYAGHNTLPEKPPRAESDRPKMSSETEEVDEDTPTEAETVHVSQSSTYAEHSTLPGVHITQTMYGKNVQVGDSNMLLDTSRGDFHDVEGACGGIDQLTLDKLSARHRFSSGDSIDRKKSYAQAACTTQHIKAENVNVFTNINISSNLQDKSPLSSKPNSRPVEFKNFLDSVSNFGNGRHFILIIGKTEQFTNLNAISLVPWTAVFDFDPTSRSSGLLSYVEENIGKRRALHINSWQDKCNIMDGSTNWMFMKGWSERPDTRTENDFKKWKRQVKGQLKSQVLQLEKFQEGYTNFTIVVIWSDSEIAQHMSFLLTEIEDNMSCSIVLVDDGKAKSDVAKSILTVFKDTCESNMITIEMSLHDVCKAISSSMSSVREYDPSEYQLPTSVPTVDLHITEQQAQLLKEDLEVLYLENKTNIQYDQKNLLEEEDNFFKGGTLPWAWWYHVGAGHVDAERDMLNDIKRFIVQRHIDICKAGCITLMHAPGSGGTTLAQRILWDLKEKTPCAQVKHRTGSSIKDLADKIQLLSDKTHLPIVLLMDGEEEQRMNLLQRMLRDYCLIILYVKRHPYSIETQNPSYEKGIFWLKTYVSAKEAGVLELKYSKQCKTENKRRAVQRLRQDVEKMQKRSIFEFGLAVHSFEYKGIESYVKGFLRLNENSNRELQPWQRALGILSLVYYYGQTTIPCHFFSNLLGTADNNGIIQLKNFPDEMKEFIVNDPSEGKSNVVRISHYYVGKEILDHILLWPKTLPRDLSSSICTAAKAKLEPFAVAFIKEAGARSRGNSPYSICKIMTRTFISRDNRPVGENETQVNRSKKPRLSPILEDMCSKAPYTERFNVLKQLTESFPMESQFLAHLGRLYTICRPEEEEAAENCFKKALEICDREVNLISNDEIPHNMKLTLMHIYHMYGNMLLLRVSKYTGKYLGDKPRVRTDELNFDDTASKLLQSIISACEYFTKCREVTPPGCEESFGFIGEITVRLMFCDFVNSNGGCENIHEYVDENKTESAYFVEQSYVALDELFIECFSVIEPDKMDNNIINCQEWYAALFNTRTPGHFLHRMEDNIQTRRMKIAIRKMQYSKKKAYGVLESVTEEADIEYIVMEYEKNFAEANDGNDGKQVLSKRAMDIDYSEWLFAIRHTLFRDDYSIEKVLQHVQRWYDLLQTQNSRFYLFITKSLLGFGSGGKNGNTELLIEAQRLKEELLKYSKHIAKPRYPREWLGSPTTSIRRLAPGRRFFGQIEGREIRYKSKDAYSNTLEIVKGTICPPNDKPAGGYIDLDLGKNNLISVKVFFVPVRAEMRGSYYIGARVEFVVGFSMSHGYEAFNVRGIGHVRCQRCNQLVEILSCEKIVVCQRCHIKLSRKETTTTKHTTENSADM